VIASDGRESFVLFLYPDAISWVQSEGKESPVSSDVPGQAGFDAGDNDRYYTLPGSGTPQVTQLARSVVDIVHVRCTCHSLMLVLRFVHDMLCNLSYDESKVYYSKLN